MTLLESTQRGSCPTQNYQILLTPLLKSPLSFLSLFCSSAGVLEFFQLLDCFLLQAREFHAGKRPFPSVPFPHTAHKLDKDKAKQTGLRNTFEHGSTPNTQTALLPFGRGLGNYAHSSLNTIKCISAENQTLTLLCASTALKHKDLEILRSPKIYIYLIYNILKHILIFFYYFIYI